LKPNAEPPKPESLKSQSPRVTVEEGADLGAVAGMELVRRDQLAEAEPVIVR
jgi:hypothetical protein